MAVAQLRSAPLVVALLALGCSTQGPGVSLTAPDRARFDAEVYPVLVRDCAFPGCHGTPERYFRVYAPGRARLDPVTPTYAAITEEESRANYERARSMVDATGHTERSLLLLKPLAVEAGGEAHAGVDRWGRDIYASSDDARLAVLAAWAWSAP